MVTKRRSGKPRMNWLDNSLKQAYDIITKEESAEEREEFDLNNDKHIFKVRDRARERKEPFSTKPKPKNVTRSYLQDTEQRT